MSDFGASVVWSWLFHELSATPFVSLGLSATAVSIDDEVTKRGTQHTRGLAFGVNGNIGVHGFATESWYWRVQAGYIGAGIAGCRSQPCIGYVFTSLQSSPWSWPRR